MWELTAFCDMRKSLLSYCQSQLKAIVRVESFFYWLELTQWKSFKWKFFDLIVHCLTDAAWHSPYIYILRDTLLRYTQRFLSLVASAHRDFFSSDDRESWQVAGKSQVSASRLSAYFCGVKLNGIIHHAAKRTHPATFRSTNERLSMFAQRSHLRGGRSTFKIWILNDIKARRKNFPIWHRKRNVSHRSATSSFHSNDIPSEICIIKGTSSRARRGKGKKMWRKKLLIRIFNEKERETTWRLTWQGKNLANCIAMIRF